ncbi:MAG: hypothetical protein K2J15_04460 [Muribaculaceae bacterium]|nr:hypothetical protein [Muribaculaceae bacterium]
MKTEIFVKRSLCLLSIMLVGLMWTMNLKSEVKDSGNQETSKIVYCPVCKGRGTDKCTSCGGRGGIVNMEYNEMPCGYCGAQGKVICPTCGGSGKIIDSKIELKGNGGKEYIVAGEGKDFCKTCNNTGDCIYCSGTGINKDAHIFSNAPANGVGTCKICHGSGKCIKCKGTGNHH